MKAGVSLLLVAIWLLACTHKKPQNKNEVLVFCASSLTEVISEIASDFEAESNTRVKLNLASSGTLARQIENGAQPGIFISANKKWIDYLLEHDKADSSATRKVAGNTMVLVAPENSALQPFDFSMEVDLPAVFEGRLSLGDPKHVPAGAYALQILQNLACADKLKPRFLPAKDVRSALMVVELGEVDAGIVYKTDALKSDKVKILTEFPDSLHQPVAYYMTLIKGAQNDRSLQLYNYIVSEKMTSVWEKYGFKH